MQFLLPGRIVEGYLHAIPLEWNWDMIMADDGQSQHVSTQAEEGMSAIIQVICESSVAFAIYETF